MVIEKLTIVENLMYQFGVKWQARKGDENSKDENCTYGLDYSFASTLLSYSSAEMSSAPLNYA